MQDSSYVRYKPSCIAAAAIYVARYTLAVTNVWPKELAAVSGYVEAALAECVRDMSAQHSRLCNGTTATAVHDKYAAINMHHVATIKHRALNDDRAAKKRSERR